MLVDGREVAFRSTQDPRVAGIGTVYQPRAVASALGVASNLFLAREQRRVDVLGKVFRMLDTGGMKGQAKQHVDDLGIITLPGFKLSSVNAACVDAVRCRVARATRGWRRPVA